MEYHMYIKIDVKCNRNYSAVIRRKIVKARLNDIIGHVISDLLDELDKISKIESSNTDIDPLIPVSVLKDFLIITFQFMSKILIIVPHTGVCWERTVCRR